ncbi:hypothetical protein OIE66_33515 [Nonomuraea sp. NBC_01738]|uniref:hypothetical protein n=1 Tax=Nonomuraea sp. NBC_01738 TaxID=2976003 RepID=UPI002E0DB8B9|nr:hypothetical protein OIE66_33515 [Nonomuraea sp. NBC_01738]
MISKVAGLDCAKDPTEPWAHQVEGESVLRDHPQGATVLVPQYVSLACDDDAEVAEVGVRYKFTGSPSNVASFYKQHAQAAGWLLSKDGTNDLRVRAKSTEGWPATSCFSKKFTSFTADLEIAFDYWSGDVEINPAQQTYWIEISFSPHGGNCANNIDNAPSGTPYSH